MLRTLCYLFIVAALTSCTSSFRIVAFVDPELSETKYRRILIYYPSTDLLRRADVEGGLASYFRSKGAEAGRMVSVVTPTRKYSEKELKERFVELGVDALLLVTDSETSERNYSSGASIYSIGTTTYVHNVETSAYSRYSNFRLIDLKQGEVAWIATVRSVSDSYASSLDNEAIAVVSNLLKTGLVTAKQNSTP